ncbi:SRPBCC domain-containing protein [Pseudobacteriovorax antillogorgiicola]|uniref:Polyketide cyclase / dehydrase and lipid transport n=1 Tax=Pseudobacteriovorax antillogorgiicola TaxID=1513793 RepID=A0A1Y6C936_9BACT|nr:SRPBCC domain-containing protein [Pseudobacteriovorax antillogorgiicola]TCS49068.1 polyketide cyclase/dehydrase/lipid transport protein [Pseudobacteriovorax antillogorgiicola]SMF52248.1 Polyketide cyclase / dehydrase and lipid transport [Pseudobacteriovorax antillogorgiicola]
MPSFETSITINAQPDKVWSVLTDFAAYKSWNPFFLDMGRLKYEEPSEGVRFLEIIRMPPGVPGIFPMEITKLMKDTTLEFTMPYDVLEPLIWDSHLFRLALTDEGGTVFTHVYDYSGICFRLAMCLPAMEGAVKDIHQRMNEELKHRVESH